MALDDNILPKESVAARIFTFNGERYLMSCVAKYGGASQVTPSLNVYNLTKGAHVEEAMENVKAAESHQSAYTAIIGGAAGIAALLRDPTRMQQLSENCAKRDYTNSAEVEKIYALME